MNDRNDINWGFLKVAIAWLSGYIGSAFAIIHAILGDLVLLATLVFTALQIVKLWRYLNRPIDTKTDWGGP